MKTEDFDFIANMLKVKSGLVLTQDKMYLLESRLNPLARKLNFATLDDMIISLKTNNEVLAKQVIDAMTTNESFFFRDSKPFDTFRNFVLPYLLKTRADKKKIRIWSAACSSGQEAYSLCMILKDFAKELEGWTIEIIGTDLSTGILEKAKDGMYTQFEVQRGLPIQFLVEHFSKQGDMWQINQNIKDMVQYKEVNLLEDFSSLGTFDAIFCRNVLIYFDKEDKTKVLEKLSRAGTKDCFLFLGGAETVFGISEKFKLITGMRGIYISSSVDDAVFSELTGHGTEKSKLLVPTASQNAVFSRPSLSSSTLTKPVSPVQNTIPQQGAPIPKPLPSTPVIAKPLASPAQPASSSTPEQRPAMTTQTIQRPSSPSMSGSALPQRPTSLNTAGGTVQSASSLLKTTGTVQSATSLLNKNQTETTEKTPVVQAQQTQTATQEQQKTSIQQPASQPSQVSVGSILKRTQSMSQTTSPTSTTSQQKPQNTTVNADNNENKE